MNQTIYENYAKLAVEIGINLQPGQDVVINASTNVANFVKEIVKVCYENKARRVTVEWSHDEITKLHYLNQDVETLSEIPVWREEKMKYAAETLPCMIHIADSDPDAFNGIDMKKMSQARQATYKVMKKYRDMMDNRYQWLIVAVPSAGWAKKVFPGLGEEEAIANLWEAIIKTMRLDQADPVQAWKDHIAYLGDKSKKLNDLNLDYLTYKSSNGTDLKLH